MSRRKPSDVESPVQRALTESGTNAWQRWSRDREQRELLEAARRQAAIDAQKNAAIHPRECARRIAEDSRRFARDWRAIRSEIGPEWGRLLKQQPELSSDLTRQRERLITTLMGTLPESLRSIVADLRDLIEARIIAHECAAFMVGWEAHRVDAEIHIDGHGCISRASRKGSRGGLRLTLAEDNEDR